jgi:hypothetical protein
MAKTILHNRFIIEIFDDSGFCQTADSPTNYHKVIQVDEDKGYVPNAQHAIQIYENGHLLNSAIVLASGGATSAFGECAHVDAGNLLIRCCNKVFSLTLPDLALNWVTQVDMATCFSLHPYKDAYISYGELTIAKLDSSGKLLWDFSGADIFVSHQGETPFEMYNTHIKLIDFSSRHYKIDYDGKLLSSAW